MPIRPTEGVVDLAAIAHNYRLAVEVGGRPALRGGKADAYGHGAVRVARALVDAGAPVLAVALVEEGIELRDAGIEAPVLVLGGAYGDAYEELVRHRLVPVVFTREHVTRLAAAARSLGVPPRLHVKVDTGMGRPGATTERQIRRFEAAWEAFAQAGIAPRLRHLANSAGTIEYAFVPQGLTRPGIMLYGYLPFDPAAAPAAAPARALLAHGHRPRQGGRRGHAHLVRWVLGRPAHLAHRHAPRGLRGRLLTPPLRSRRIWLRPRARARTARSRRRDRLHGPHHGGRDRRPGRLGGRRGGPARRAGERANRRRRARAPGRDDLLRGPVRDRHACATPIRSVSGAGGSVRKARSTAIWY